MDTNTPDPAAETVIRSLHGVEFGRGKPPTAPAPDGLARDFSAWLTANDAAQHAWRQFRADGCSFDEWAIIAAARDRAYRLLLCSLRRAGRDHTWTWGRHAFRLETSIRGCRRERVHIEGGGLMNRPRIVCLCGSTRFKDQFIEANFRETMAGRIVLTVGRLGHADGEVHAPTPEEKEALDTLHLRKIDLADEILVINVGNYVGESTRREIAHATATGKPIRWLEGPPR